MNKKHLITVISISLILALYFFVSTRKKSIWPAEYVQLDSGYRPIMGTFARVVAVAKDSTTAKKCIQIAFEQLLNVDQLMSDYKSDSEISEINRDGFKRPIKVSKSTFEVLQKAIKFSKLSNGAFDITIGPLVDLWHQAADANSHPTDAQLQQARSKIGYELLHLDANEMTVRFAVDGMRIDLGGIAKGYAIDKAIQAIQKAGAIGAMVDIGGDMRCFGTPPQGRKYWLIGLQNPNITKDDIVIPAQAAIQASQSLLTLKLKDAAIATSGGYRRFALIEGKKYSHIINTKTAVPIDNLASVTIISKNAIDADALATAVSVLGPQKGLALIEKIPETEAILIPANSFNLIKSTGAKKYIK